MKQFFKFVFATMLGIILTTVLFLIVIVAIVVASSGNKNVVVAPNSVMRIAFNNPIAERTPNKLDRNFRV